MRLKPLVQRIHLWAGLILGFQVVLWMASGLVMSWFPSELVKGETSAFKSPPIALDALAYASPGGIIAQTEGAATVELRRFMGRPVYVASNENGAVAMFDASSGEKLTPLKEATIRRIAKQDFVGDGKIIRARLMNYPPKEYRAETPVWRVDFDDKRNTRLYISPSSGEVRARRNDVWRLYDFFWMLHIMDYGERENPNNPFVVTAAATGLVFALSGFLMVILGLINGRYGHDIKLLARNVSRKGNAVSQKKDQNAK